MAVTLIRSDDQSFNLFQTKLKADLDPVLANLLVQGSLITNVNLIAGVNVINHLLGRQQQGWILADQTAVSNIYRSAPFNDKTLALNASAPVQVNLWVF